MHNQRPVIGVIGAAETSDEQYQLAFELGGHIANRGAVLVCGGLGGIMEACSKGAAENGGTVIGILPGDKKKDANPYINIAIPTGMGISRNVLVVHTADVIIAFPGALGTLSEIALALATGKTVIYLPGAWDLKKIGKIDSSYFKEAFDPRQAIGLALDAFRLQS
ncbi:MAG TPA: TIGR00725 family protein [Chitinispirillaceae bacterium]|nr:TIGR00725 family protein [Chitinispirillaceae bacterium]